MTETEKLIARRNVMQQEQTDLRQQIADWKARLTVLAETRRQALKRYDIGHDDAQAEAAEALDETIATEAAIAKAERQLAEYPARMHAINQEVERTSYRDRCKQLLALQADERNAWAEVEAVIHDFYTAWFNFEQARRERKAMSRSLTNAAGTYGFTSPGNGDFPAPGVLELQRWLEMKAPIALEQIEAAISKASAAR